MSDISIRVVGKAGRITLNRPDALNALTYDMIRRIAAAIDDWETDDAVKLVVLDATGTKAFCAGGDIAEMYATATAGDFAYGRRFWADEYRLNARLSTNSKPIVALMQGFTMGGGVGIGCHCSHRIVCETSQIAMPECGIGLVPDVGGSMILATAPGHVGEFLGMTSTRMGAGDAIWVGFADHFVPEEDWPDLVAALETSGDPGAINVSAAPSGQLPGQQADIDAVFSLPDVGQIVAALEASDADFAAKALKSLRRNSPLSVACTFEIVRRVREAPNIRNALSQEYRFTWRSADMGDFIEGIRAQIIDKDRNPAWADQNIEAVSAQKISAMLAPLGSDATLWEQSA